MDSILSLWNSGTAISYISLFLGLVIVFKYASGAIMDFIRNKYLSIASPIIDVAQKLKDASFRSRSTEEYYCKIKDFTQREIEEGKVKRDIVIESVNEIIYQIREEGDFRVSSLKRKFRIKLARKKSKLIIHKTNELLVEYTEQMPVKEHEDLILNSLFVKNIT